MRLLFCFAIFFTFTVQAQTLQLDTAFHCSYYAGDYAESIRLYPATKEAKRAIQDIVDVVGLRPNFEIHASNVDNAAAIVYNGKRYILYSSTFMDAINSAAQTDWAGISILAHEIGHHLNGHTLTGTGSRPDLELEADEFSGFVLRKMGSSLIQAQRAMELAASAKQSHTHPARKDRLVAIAAGWNNADRQISGKPGTLESKKDVKKPVVTENVKKAEPLLAEKYIAYDVFFSADPQGEYHVTIRNNLVKVSGNDLFIVGRLAQSNNKKFPFMFYYKEYNYMYIASSGDVFNGRGKKVGKMKARE